jgi:hypothetical protein
MERMEQTTVGEQRPQMSKRVRVLLTVLITSAAAAIVLAAYIAAISDSSAAESDFISYWAAGHLLVHGQNPYDIAAVRALETGAGRKPGEQVLMMRNPPLAFFMVLPFGNARPKTGVIAWLFVLIGALAVASFLIWRLNGRPDSLFNFFGFGFASVLACLMAGQCGILLLLGIALFLFLYNDRPFLAGAALLLCALKPHFFTPFGIALVLWCVTTKKGHRAGYGVLAGACVAVAGSCLLAYVLDPHAWSQYSEMMRTGGALNEVVPRLGAELRLLIDPRAVWVQFILEMAACVWTVWYFLTRRAVWNWMDHGLLLLLVGAVCTPYGFLTDESLLLPAILAGVYRSIASKKPLWPVGVLAGAELIELFAGATIVSPYYLWTAPAWLCWYLYATDRFSPRLVPATA